MRLSTSSKTKTHHTTAHLTANHTRSCQAAQTRAFGVRPGVGVAPEALGCAGHEKHDTGVELWTAAVRFAAVGTGVGGIGVGDGCGVGVCTTACGVDVAVAANDCRATLPRP